MLYRGRTGTRGFTLIELAIVLGITGLLFTGLWRLLSNGNQQLRDQATASQQQQLITAISTYLATSNGQNWMAAIAANTSATLPLPPAANPAGSAGCAAAVAPLNVDLCTILPPGFSATTVNPYGQVYNIHVLKDNTTNTPATPPQSFSFMIVTSGGDTVPDTDGGRISSMIGGDGGFIYSNNVCTPGGGTVSHWACGAYGAWAQDITVNYGFTAAFAASGTVASRTYYSPTQNSLQPWLARQVMPGDTNFGYNTMSTDMYVSGNGATGVPYNINLAPFTGLGALLTGGSINMVLPGSTGGGGAINMAAGAINMNGGLVGGVPQLTGGGPINMNGGNINMVGTAAATTGGGVFNLQGGEIEDTSTAPAININTGAIPLDNGGTPPKPTALVTVGTDCSVDGVSGLGTGAADSNCAPGIQVQGDQVVLGRLNANSLYAQTFIYNSSDMRLKTDIHTMKDPLESVMKLNPVDFKFKATGQEGLGVIAQDVEKIYPQLVSMRGDGMKAVNYEGLIAPLIGAVQELKKENDDLRQQVRDQAIRQDELERQLKSKSTSR